MNINNRILSFLILYVLTTTLSYIVCATDIDLGEVTITDSQDYDTAWSIKTESFTTIITIDPADASKSIATILEDEAGVKVTSTGGESGISTVSLRGSTSKNVLIMLDGIPLNSGGMSSVDLNLIPSDIIERIEITRGGDSALYGSAAMGGVINIVTKTSKRIGYDLAVSAISGRKIGESAAFYFKNERINLLLSHSLKFDSGLFLFLNKKNTVKTSDDLLVFRLNNRLLAVSNMLSGQIDLPRKMNLQFSLLHLLKDNGVAGPVGFTNHFRDAHMTSHMLQNTLRYNSGLLSPHLHFLVNLYHRFYPTRYTNSTEQGAGSYSMINLLHNWGGKGSVSLLSIPFNTITAEIDLQGEFMHDAVADLPLTSSPSRFTVSGMIRDEILLWQERIGIIPTIRFNYTTGPGFHFAWKTGFFIKPVSMVTIKSTVFHSFRNPDFSELYYTYGLYLSNPDLLPEQVYGGDMGIIFKNEKLTMEGALFFNYYLDLIRYILSYGYVFKPINIGSAGSFGGEFLFSYRPTKVFHLQIQYTLNYLLDFDELYRGIFIQLPGQPLHKLSALIELSISRITLGFRTVIKDRTNITRTGTKYLPSRQVMDAYIKISIDDRKKRYRGVLYINFNNILNVQFEDIRGYPLEGFVIDAGVQFRI